MPLFAEGEMWNNMAQIIVAVATLVVAICNGLGTLWGHWVSSKNQKELKQDLKENTEVTKTIMPAVKEKTDSAVKAAEETKAAAEKIQENAAAKVGQLIGKVLSEKAEKIADKTAAVAAQVAVEVANKNHEAVEKLTTAIKGTDGTCLTSKVTENTKRIDDLHARMDKVESDVHEIKGDVHETKDDTKQIINLLAARETGT